MRTEHNETATASAAAQHLVFRQQDGRKNTLSLYTNDMVLILRVQILHAIHRACASVTAIQYCRDSVQENSTAFASCHCP